MKPTVSKQGLEPSAVRHGVGSRQPSAFPFVLYCVFTISFLVHLGSRIPALGAMHFDVVIGGAALLLAVLQQTQQFGPAGGADQRWSEPSRWLLILIAFIVLTLPFVRWPGSVIRHGMEPFAKAIFFYVLTVLTVTSERRLAIFLTVFVTCQVFRVLEPLYLHVTTGYWGSTTHMGNWVMMDRLSGAPSDVVNPNGLAYIIVTTIPLLHFFVARQSTIGRAVYLGLLPALVWVLLLTGSRSGFIVMLVTALLILVRTKSRLLGAVILTIGLVGGLAQLSGLQQQRFESIVSEDAGGAETFQGRIDGVTGDLKAALERPLFGHGLGTSMEVNAHVRGIAQLSHNLFTEVAQELGFVGLAIFLAFLFKAFQSSRSVNRSLQGTENAALLLNTSEALVVIMLSCAVFALASYGFSELYWYLWAGLCVAIHPLARKRAALPVERVLESKAVSPHRSQAWDRA